MINAVNARSDRRIDKKHPDMVFAFRTIATGAMACGFCACQATESTLESPPVMEGRQNDVKTKEKVDAEVIRIGGSPAHSLPVGDWQNGGPVSESKKTPTTEG
jgi:hypothetical protein